MKDPINDNHPNQDPRKQKLILGVAPGDLPLLGFSFAFQTGVYTVVTHHLFAAPGEIRPALLAGSAFIAGFITTVEVKTIVLPSYWFKGRQFLKLGGVELPSGTGTGIKLALASLVRGTISVGSSVIVAVSIASQIFKPDIETWVQNHSVQQNARLIETSTKVVDDQIQRATTALADETARTNTLSSQTSNLRRKALTGRTRERTRQQLAALEAVLAGEDAKVERRRDELAKLVANRGDAINQAVVNAPDYRPPQRGFLFEISALDSIAQEEPHAAAMIATVELLGLSMELALLIAKIFDTAPSAFAGARAREIYLEAVRMAKGMLDELEDGPDDKGGGGGVSAPRRAANDNFPFPKPGMVVNAAARGPDDRPPQPPKRRGRPRKHALN